MIAVFYIVCVFGYLLAGAVVAHFMADDFGGDEVDMAMVTILWPIFAFMGIILGLGKLVSLFSQAVGHGITKAGEYGKERKGRVVSQSRLRMPSLRKTRSIRNKNAGTKTN